MLKSFIDRHYRLIRPFRFLYGWAKDSHSRAKCSARASEWEAKGYRGAKLDVCGGRNPFNPKEFLNVDAVALPQVDLVFDITEKFPMDDGVIAEVFSAATLEHLREVHNVHVLKEFFRIMQPGATVRICTPDIEAIAKGILDGEDLHYINQHLFGKYKSNQTEDYDLHKWMYPADRLMEVLREIGFIETERIALEEVGLHDPKYNFLVRAVKPR
jgi:predicted SAM-dependent methyltransferase